MKSNSNIVAFAGIVLLTMVFKTSDLKSQAAIVVDEVPLDIGTFIITENDTVDTVYVDVGSPGENMVWRFDADFPGKLIRQLIVTKDSAPYHELFPDAKLRLAPELRSRSLLDKTQHAVVPRPARRS